MRYFFQFLIILGFAFAGELFHYFIPLPIPASIYGIILLFLALEFKILKVKYIKEVSSFLIATMPVMFLPPAVGIIDSWNLVGESLMPFVIVTFCSTIFVMVTAGLVTQFVIRAKKRREEK